VDGARTADDKQTVRCASDDGNGIFAALQDSLESRIRLDEGRISNRIKERRGGESKANYLQLELQIEGVEVESEGRIPRLFTINH
jgi:hypothetical protein